MSTSMGVAPLNGGAAASLMEPIICSQISGDNSPYGATSLWVEVCFFVFPSRFLVFAVALSRFLAFVSVY
ncbi:hypothetical protein [Paraburkholderia tagetis]|uniref:hypothetical protein n=1 Tax=Paraburkholderia tagetis TaxID=2913261 RepID=UPI001EE4DB29|nr:hypothetical protein [Paraburkholderia tagetis]